MNRATEYRKLASEFRGKARLAPSPKQAAEFYELARSYLRLAEEADRNSRTDIVYEPPPPKAEL